MPPRCLDRSVSAPLLEEIAKVVRFGARGLEPPEVDPHIEDARGAYQRSHERLREHDEIDYAAHDRRDRERLKIEPDNCESLAKIDCRDTDEAVQRDRANRRNRD